MSIFSVSDFERLGTTEDDMRLTDIKEIKKKTIEITDSAIRSIDIFTPDLEASIYNNEDFSKTLLRFVRENSNANIRILLIDSSHAIKSGHRILRLAQNITSSLIIRKPVEDYLDINASFIIADSISFIFHSNSFSNGSLYTPNSKPKTDRLLDFFNRAWDSSEQDIQTKRLSI
jgi:hypothetical protein